MDEDKLHKQLNDRIRDVFDNYEDTTADEGWAALRHKFPAEKKDRGLAWLWYAAAAIVLLGIGLWFMLPKEQAPQFANNGVPHSKPSPVKEQLKDSTNNDPAQTITKPSVTSPGGQQIATTATSPSVNYGQASASAASGRRPASVSMNVVIAANTPKTNTATPPNKTTPEAKPIVEASEQYAVAASTKAETVKEYAKADSSATRNIEVIAQNKAAGKTETISSAEAMARMLAADKPATDKIGTKKTDKKTVIGVYAGTFFNYADGSENRVNVGAGVSSDFSISRNLKISTGVAIAQNSLNYNYDVYKGSQLYAAALDVGLDAKSSALSYSAPVPKSYRASLIGLDIPVNLKYQFDPKKNDTYISAGVSSGTFLNETYVLDYNIGNTKEQTTTQAKFSDFYLAKTLNVSFGIGYPLGKSNRLVIEPFLKYPLGGMGTQQIKFGSGGVNLKLNFSGMKK